MANKTYVYTYDNAGNIISKKTYSLTAAGITPTSLTRTDSYTYGNTSWGDLLTAYQGHTITYDSIGNPLSYYNGTSYTFTWEGRRLVGAVKGSKTMSFEYNDEGIRTSKTVNNVKHSYYLNGSQIVAEQWSDKLIVYLYDATGAPMGMMYRTTAYAEEQWDVFWFEKNLQGDIVAVYNSEGTKVVTYTYSDAWGNHTATYHNGSISTGVQYNPFRYRGYYYDTDLGMYYLQSRYYDARIGRFINADGYVSTGQGLTGNNMFAYCGNNPVNRVDPNGEGWLGVVVLVVFLVFTLTSCSSSKVVEEITEESINLYSDTEGKRQEGKINVKFSPDNKDSQGNSNPSFQIENSADICNIEQQKFILNYIMESEFYDQDVYGRTIDSMLIEWDAHNELYSVYKHNRLKHTDFDKNSEGWTKKDYYDYAIKEGWNEYFKK